MVPEERLSEILRSHSSLRDAGEALVAPPTRPAGGTTSRSCCSGWRTRPRRRGHRSGDGGAERACCVRRARASTTPRPPPPLRPRRCPRSLRGPRRSPPPLAAPTRPSLLAPPPQPVRPRSPRMPTQAERRGGRRAPAHAPPRIAAVVLVVLGVVASGGVSGARIGLLRRHQLPRPGHALSRRALPAARRDRSVQPRIRHGRQRLDALARAAADAADHSLRSEGDAASLLRSLELGQLGE